MKRDRINDAKLRTLGGEPRVFHEIEEIEVAANQEFHIRGYSQIEVRQIIRVAQRDSAIGDAVLERCQGREFLHERIDTFLS